MCKIFCVEFQIPHKINLNTDIENMILYTILKFYELLDLQAHPLNDPGPNELSQWLW